MHVDFFFLWQILDLLLLLWMFTFYIYYSVIYTLYSHEQSFLFLIYTYTYVYVDILQRGCVQHLWVYNDYPDSDSTKVPLSFCCSSILSNNPLKVPLPNPL